MGLIDLWGMWPEPIEPQTYSDDVLFEVWAMQDDAATFEEFKEYLRCHRLIV